MTYERVNVLVRNARIACPSNIISGTADITIEGGIITEILDLSREPSSGSHGHSARKDASGLKVIDAAGMVVIPGLIDMHAHLREPGFEHKETIATGTLAAVSGGFTAVCCMPNTMPPNDTPAVTEFIRKRAAEKGSCTVYPIGCITKGQKGEELAETGLLREAGCVAFSDDGRPVMNSMLMRRALEYGKAFGVAMISHAEDLHMAGGGSMNEGTVSTRLGLRGIPAAAEEIMIARDIILARITGGNLHIAHVSTAEAVRLIRQAKESGIAVTAETCPHYFTLTDEAVGEYNTDAKVNPPLRTQGDCDAIREGLRDGTIDVIATDHAPHHRDEKLMSFEKAPPGISGFETALSASLTLVRGGILTLPELVEKICMNPARILGLPVPAIRVGAHAELVIVDPEMEFTVNPGSFFSLGKNTPFRGMTFKGMPVITIIGDRVFEKS